MPLLWLVERDVDSRNLLNLTYATTDGERVYRRQMSAEAPGSSVTAAVDVEADRLEDAAEDDVDRFASEARRMADRHEPDETV